MSFLEFDHYIMVPLMLYLEINSANDGWILIVMHHPLRYHSGHLPLTLLKLANSFKIE